MAELISVIVSTYNREDALDAVLRALACQSDRGFEAIIADDGSRPETECIVNRWSSRLGVPLVHVWHEDLGFRLAEIRNRAILASSGVTCVFLDGDSIPRPDFVAAHRRLSEPGWFVAGNRALLSADVTQRILEGRLQPELWSMRAWAAARFRGHVNRLLPLLRIRGGPLRKIGQRSWRSARGGNLAIRRDDLDRVDGFDARFSGWGLEDSDIVIRLLRSGVRRKDGRFATGVLHLWHPTTDRSRLGENMRALDEVICGTRVQAIRGMSTLRGAPASSLAKPKPADGKEAAAPKSGMSGTAHG